MEGLTMFIREMEQFPITAGLSKIYSRGWGNGYVTIPEGHPFYGKSWTEIDVQVHGGLTFSEMADDDITWVIGFDTMHYGDSLENWPESEVAAETARLLQQCQEATRLLNP